MSQHRSGSRRARSSSKRARGGPPPGSRRRSQELPPRTGVAPALVAVVAVFGLLGVGLLIANPLAAPGPTPIPTAAPTQVAIAGCPTSQPPALAAGETRTVTIETPLGNLVIKVAGSLAPIAAGNFVALAQCGYYDGVVFHRVATLQDGTPFVIQGGDGQFGRSGSLDMTNIGTGGPGYTIQDEPVTTTYGRGTVAMARTSQPNSEGSQFFIVLDDADASVLASANNYAIFGTVTSGMDVADAIYHAADKEVPTNPIPMTKVTVATP
jgi:peptidyl-prolyl cis-trans isomerase B (cyclophilin B)